MLWRNNTNTNKTERKPVKHCSTVESLESLYKIPMYLFWFLQRRSEMLVIHSKLYKRVTVTTEPLPLFVYCCSVQRCQSVESTTCTKTRTVFRFQKFTIFATDFWPFAFNRRRKDNENQYLLLLLAGRGRRLLGCWGLGSGLIPAWSFPLEGDPPSCLSQCIMGHTYGQKNGHDCKHKKYFPRIDVFVNQAFCFVQQLMLFLCQYLVVRAHFSDDASAPATSLPKWVAKPFGSEVTETSLMLGVTVQLRNSALDFGAMLQRRRRRAAVAGCKWALIKSHWFQGQIG